MDNTAIINEVKPIHIDVALTLLGIDHLKADNPERLKNWSSVRAVAQAIAKYQDTLSTQAQALNRAKASLEWCGVIASNQRLPFEDNDRNANVDAVRKLRDERDQLLRQNELLLDDNHRCRIQAPASEDKCACGRTLTQLFDKHDRDKARADGRVREPARTFSIGTSDKTFVLDDVETTEQTAALIIRSAFRRDEPNLEYDEGLMPTQIKVCGQQVYVKNEQCGKLLAAIIKGGLL